MLFILLLLLGLGFVIRSYVAGRRPHLAFTVGLGLVAAAFLAPGIAGASPDEETPVGPDADANSLFELDAYTVTILLGFAIPLINGLVTKATTSTKVKAILTLVMSAVAGVVNVSLTDGGGAVFSQDTIKSAFLTLIISITTYLGVFKPLELTSSPVTKVDENGNRVTVDGKLAHVGVK